MKKGWKLKNKNFFPRFLILIKTTLETTLRKTKKEKPKLLIDKNPEEQKILTKYNEYKTF